MASDTDVVDVVDFGILKGPRLNDVRAVEKNGHVFEVVPHEFQQTKFLIGQREVPTRHFTRAAAFRVHDVGIVVWAVLGLTRLSGKDDDGVVAVFFGILQQRFATIHRHALKLGGRRIVVRIKLVVAGKRIRHRPLGTPILIVFLKIFVILDFFLRIHLVIGIKSAI